MTGLLAALALAAACSHGGTGGPNPKPFASGTFRNAAGDRVGLATLTDSAGTVRLGVSASQLSPGPHGLHFHAQGTCTPPDFTSAGAHFNPDGRKHGRLNPEGPHLGDLPNLVPPPVPCDSGTSNQVCSDTHLPSASVDSVVPPTLVISGSEAIESRPMSCSLGGDDQSCPPRHSMPARSPLAL